jgi:hypothetical protein
MKRVILIPFFLLIFTSFTSLNAQWALTYGGSYSDVAQSIQQTNDGGYIIAGETRSFGAGLNDIWILKLDSNGATVWQRTYGGSYRDIARSIQQTGDGGYIVAGDTESFGAGMSDIWVLKLDSNGATVWQRTYGGSGGDVARTIQQTDDGGYIVAGYTESYGAGANDFFVLKLYSDGNVDPSCGLVGSSEATIADTYISPENTNIIPQDTNIIPFETSASPYDTEASVYSICPPQEYTLNISANYRGTTDPSPGSYRYDIGEVVTVTAIANSGYKFSEWSGDVTGKDNPVTITMDSDKSVTANFKNNCFLAKVFSGSSFYAQLESLRDFRDKYLISNRFGLSLVNLYYRHSQFFVDIIAKHKALKLPVRTSLLPLIAFSYSLVHLGPPATAIIFSLFFILPAFLNSFFQRKLRRAKANKV